MIHFASEIWGLCPDPRAEPGFPWQQVPKLLFQQPEEVSGGCNAPHSNAEGCPRQGHCPPPALAPTVVGDPFSSNGAQPCAASGFPEPLHQRTSCHGRWCLSFAALALPIITLLRGMGAQGERAFLHGAPGSPASPSLINWGPCGRGFVTQPLLEQEPPPSSIPLPRWD